MSARRDLDSPIVTFRVAKRAIRAELRQLPRLIYPEAHEALTVALAAVSDPAEVHLPFHAARDLRHWLKAMAFRATKAGSPHAEELSEAAESLELELYRLAEW